ncbi:MAG: alpha/beta fold hydrolase [Myxococcaceae bacterium]|nr:alpha/beta fold hydrolase [Myxococcaceae bacterium]
MDASDTAPFSLGPSSVSKPREAVLLLHGFTGSPWEVRPLGESLAARGYHVLAPRLPGHGSSPEALLFVSSKDWERTAEAALHQLADFERVFVAGLSMGALLSLLLAARFPRRVAALALMAPALKLASKASRVLEALRVLDRHPLDGLWVPKHASDLEDDAVRATAPKLSRFPARRLRDVFHLQDLAAHAISQVQCPSVVLVSENDHVIDVAAASSLPRRLPQSRLVLFQRGFHLMPRDVDRARVASEVGAFFDAHSRRG